MALQELVIVGAGGFAREVHDVVDAINDREEAWRVVGYVADGHADGDELARRGSVVLGPVSHLEKLDKAVRYVIGIGDGSARRTIDGYATGLDLAAATLVHPGATVGRHGIDLQAGVVVCAGVVLTTNIAIGRHSHVNIGSTVGHDAVIGSYVTISPGAHLSGRVSLGDEVTLGTGASVLPGVTVGAGATVGAQAAVVKDVGPGLTVVGIPARPVG